MENEIGITNTAVAVEKAETLLEASTRITTLTENFIEKYIPPMVMISLLFYCLKDVSFASTSGFFPQLIGVLITIFIHLWKHNSLLSIFSGTIIYMFFTKILY